MITTLVVITAFLAGVAVVVALGFVLRDLSSRRYNVVNRRLSLDAPQSDIAAYYREQQTHTGGFDQWFYSLVNDSGVGLDVPTAMMLILGFGTVFGTATWVVCENLLWAAVGTMVGIGVPMVWLYVKRLLRIREMYNQLPEAFQIIADSVRTGYSLEQSSEMAANELRAPLNSEFDQCASQLKLGNSPTAVMEQMSARIPLPEFQVFATAVTVQQTVGGNLPLLTERLAHAARERQEFTGHVNAVTAGSRLSAIGLVIGSIFAMVALTWLEPEYVSAFVNHELGPTLLATAIGLQLIGVFWIWRLIRVSY